MCHGGPLHQPCGTGLALCPGALLLLLWSAERQPGRLWLSGLALGTMGSLTSFRRAPSSIPAKASSAILLAPGSVRPLRGRSSVPVAPTPAQGVLPETDISQACGRLFWCLGFPSSPGPFLLLSCPRSLGGGFWLGVALCPRVVCLLAKGLGFQPRQLTNCWPKLAPHPV